MQPSSLQSMQPTFNGVRDLRLRLRKFTPEHTPISLSPICFPTHRDKSERLSMTSLSDHHPRGFHSTARVRTTIAALSSFRRVRARTDPKRQLSIIFVIIQPINQTVEHHKLQLSVSGTLCPSRVPTKPASHHMRTALLHCSLSCHLRRSYARLLLVGKTHFYSSRRRCHHNIETYPYNYTVTCGQLGKHPEIPNPSAYSEPDSRHHRVTPRFSLHSASSPPSLRLYFGSRTRRISPCLRPPSGHGKHHQKAMYE